MHEGSSKRNGGKGCGTFLSESDALEGVDSSFHLKKKPRRIVSKNRQGQQHIIPLNGLLEIMDFDFSDPEHFFPFL